MQNIFDTLYQKSKNGGSFSNLIQLIKLDANILLAYRNIKSNRGSHTAGTDNKTIDFYKDWSNDYFVRYFQNKIENYYPKSIRRVEIPKPSGKKRPLGIPCMDDRIIQQCIKQVLEPICEAKFHDHSYGFRPNRGTSHAIARCYKLMNIDKLHYAVDIDIKGFFDNVNHAKLIKQMWNLGIRDKNLICVIGKMLKAEVKGLGIPIKGTPQGGILSPLLSNIVLNELDWWISSQWETKKTRHNFPTTRIRNGKIEKDNSSKRQTLRQSSKLKEMFIVRYADDFKIFCRDYKTAQKVYIATLLWLKDRLHLEISADKSKITNTRKNKTEFLGFVLKMKVKGNKWVCESHMSEKAMVKTINELKSKVKNIRYNAKSAEVNKLNVSILGSHNYYKIATHVSADFAKINFLVRRHLYNSLRVISSNKIYRTKIYDRYYGKYNGKVTSICNVTIFPIYGIKNKYPINFSQNICNYTEEGRELIHKKINGIEHLIKYLLAHGTSSLELDDNKLSLMCGQKGRCHVSNEELSVGNMECHHKLPKSQGGTDAYENLVWLTNASHKLVHCTEIQTIKRYMDKVKLDVKGFKRLNALRLQVGNSKI